MKAKKITSLIMALAVVTSLSACGEKTQENGKVSLKIGAWPNETAEKALAERNKVRDEFMAENPNVEIEGDTYTFDTKTFTMKASAGQLPNLYKVPFTEPASIISAGYAADITDEVKKRGWDKAMNSDLFEYLTDEDGKIYGVLSDAYAQGLYIDKKLFKDAGLVNEDGSVKVPQTYQELAEYAKTIKDKTGTAGLAFPTINNCGGWYFMNVAWCFGTTFEEQKEDGTWEATFNTQETIDALQYMKDLKWKYNAILDDAAINQTDLYKYFGSYQAGMMFSSPPCSRLTRNTNMNIDDIFVTNMPAGPKGRYSQMGGNVWMFSANSTPEQIEAGLDWLEYTGISPDLTDKQAENLRSSYQTDIELNNIIPDKEPFPVWTSGNGVEERNKIRAEFANVDPANYEQYYGFEGVTIRTEPKACCQQLYAILDGCIQEVFANENADCAELIKKACEDFQVNHLDKM